MIDILEVSGSESSRVRSLLSEYTVFISSPLFGSMQVFLMLRVVRFTRASSGSAASEGSVIRCVLS